MNTPDTNTTTAAPAVTIAPRNPAKGVLLYVVTLTDHQTVRSYPCRTLEKATTLASRMQKSEATDGTDREFFSAVSVKSVAPACFATLQHSNTPLDPMNPTDQNALNNLTAEAADDIALAKKDIKCPNVTKFVPFSLIRRPRGV